MYGTNQTRPRADPLRLLPEVGRWCVCILTILRATPLAHWWRSHSLDVTALSI